MTAATAAVQEWWSADELVLGNLAAVRRICARLVDPVSADDLAQETFVRALRSSATYRGEAPPIGWLATIARRVCADELAGRRRERERAARLAAVPAPVHADPTPSVDLADLLDRLPEDQRAAFVLTSVLGLSYVETAELMNCPVGTVRSRVARARARLVADLHTGPDEASGSTTRGGRS